ncbi:DUF4132 domain-containing protein [Klebsiella spallanzanii]|uniref:DUF4132 domain-containing protein n=1 Tax=Klebsiella spallanzanii TaxID=2587528 RepID=UPI001159955D|nr:DUF4132 domain-containing protein [Klebsiella spallanzanii]VUT01368.1 hypothetical protein SB6419_01640 [Klebsiella spallanzanii]
MKIFIYQDDKSHKFWSVEQQANELHLRWGKVGSNGQSQVKAFADSAAAAKAEQKLINEKVKKGYLPQEAPTTEQEPVIDASALWLADDAVITLPEDIAEEALSHRDRPGAPVAMPETPQLAEKLRRQAQRINSLDSQTCRAEWKRDIAQALATDLSEEITLSPRMMAVLLLPTIRPLIRYGYADKEHASLLDEIVLTWGLEYATEVVVACLHLYHDAENRNNYSTFHVKYTHRNKDLWFGECEFELRLRKHLSLADELTWQNCADKLIAAIADTPADRQPLIALLLPERPEIANNMALRLSTMKDMPDREWLKLAVTDTQALAALEKCRWLRIFEEDRRWAATLLLDRGVPALARLAPYAGQDGCADVLAQVSHPQAIKLLLAAAKNAHQQMRLAQACKQWPAAAIAALAENITEQPNLIWRTQLLNLLHQHPMLAERVATLISEPAHAVLEELRQQNSCFADNDELPPVLVSPPWASKQKKSRQPVLQLPALPLVAKMSPFIPASNNIWVNDHDEVMQKTAQIGEATPEQALELLGGRCNAENIQAWQRGDYAALGDPWFDWNLSILPGLERQIGLALWNTLTRAQHVGTAYPMAHFGIDGIPGLVNSVARQPKEALPVTLHFAATELAPLIARAYCKLKSGRDIASSWLLKYPEHAIAGLLPDALGKPGNAQGFARQALQLLVENNHAALIHQVAQRWQQPEVITALDSLLNGDQLNNYPARRSPLPTFYQPTFWTRPQLKLDGKALPDDALLHLGTMLRFPSVNEIYPGLLQVKAACTPQSLAAFAWDLYNAWIKADSPKQEEWAFIALGIFGNDDTARRLTPLIRDWPGKSHYTRAATGVDLLARIGSDIALMQIRVIAQKTTSTALQDYANAVLKKIADQRRLSLAELEDDSAPNLGLNGQGTLLLDFGPRQFSVAFDDAWQPVVRNMAGERLNDLPTAGKNDDPARAAEAILQFKTLKEDARTAIPQQIRRLETAMCQRRRWTFDRFRRCLVEHPLLRHLSQRLIWGVYGPQNQLLHGFRIAEDGSFSDINDNTFCLPPGDLLIGIPHIMEMSPADAAAFAQIQSDYALLPPFRQLNRVRSALTPEERSATRLFRWYRQTCASGRVIGLTAKGWLRGVPGYEDKINYLLKPLGEWTLVLSLNEGFKAGMPPDTLSAEQTDISAWLWHGQGRDYGDAWREDHPFSVLDDITASELINDINALFE